MTSDNEQKLSAVFDSLDIKYERLKQVLYDMYNIDFYLPQKNLAIEVNGPTHLLKPID